MIWNDCNIWERSGSRSSAQSSLCWDERCFCTKNRHASCRIVVQWEMTVPWHQLVLCDPEQNMWQSHATVQKTWPSHCTGKRLWRWFVALLSNLLHCLWKTGLAATSPVTLKSVTSANESRSEWVPHEDAPFCTQFGALQGGVLVSVGRCGHLYEQMCI